MFISVSTVVGIFCFTATSFVVAGEDVLRKAVTGTDAVPVARKLGTTNYLVVTTYGTSCSSDVSQVETIQFGFCFPQGANSLM